MVDLLTQFRGEAGLALARAAIDELARHSAATSPTNYEIWTSYLAGANPELNREIETRLLRGEPFTDGVSEELFERYFAKTRLSAQMVEASASIARQLTDVITSLRGAGAQAGNYAGELHAAAQDMESGADPAAVRTILARLAATTREMVVYNRSLEQRMEASSRQVETLQTALQNVRVEALTDGLTGLANRKHFDEVLRARLAEAESTHAGLCLLMCDIDSFKRVNDTWGHQIGDQVIRYVASVLHAQAGGDFLAARYGGEEFALIMPRTELATAAKVAELIRATIKAKTLSRKSTGEILGRVTISLGVARRAPKESASSFISRADACLYQSKRAGRDRVTTETSLEPASAA
ncbi:hypothetical protein U91I_01499 [alpha proteobacterium U9-1i]|nr:hypothetical protein U91I_01499 [alpha proteobacterium U9-1i]